MGISWNVGDALCFKILMMGEGRDQIINRSVVLPRDSNAPVPTQFLGYPRDNIFPKLIEGKKRDPSPIEGGEVWNRLTVLRGSG